MNATYDLVARIEAALMHLIVQPSAMSPLAESTAIHASHPSKTCLNGGAILAS